MLEGLGRLALLVPDAKPKSKRSNPKAGRAILESIYGDQSEKLLVNLKRLQPELPSWILQETYGRVFTRSGLSIQEREILNIVVLANQGLEKQLFSHLRGALRVGLKRRQIEVALTKTERLCGKNLKTSFEALATLAVR
jgi:4-carboxymuconolactone decarboxylase